MISDKDEQNILDDYYKIQNLVKHEGWTKIIKPRLELKREVLIKSLLLSDKLEDFLQYKWAIRAIEDLFAAVDQIVAEGRQILYKDKHPEDEDTDSSRDLSDGANTP